MFISICFAAEPKAVFVLNSTHAPFFLQQNVNEQMLHQQLKDCIYGWAQEFLGLNPMFMEENLKSPPVLILTKSLH